MNMADYQLDMDLLRTMATSQAQHSTQSMGSFEEKNLFLQDGNLQDLHFMDQGSQTSTPICQQPNDYMDQDDILTPLISPAITPSFSYHPKLHNGTVGNDIDFSPLTSPAMIPQQENYSYQYVHHQRQHPFIHHNHHQAYPTTSTSAPSSDLRVISADEINDQYEELEKTKVMIARRLSELEKQQMNQGNINISIQAHQHIVRNPTTYMTEYSNGTMATYSKSPSDVQPQARLEPVTPASLMNMRQQERQKTTFSRATTSMATPISKTRLSNSRHITPSHKQGRQRQPSADLKANPKARRSSAHPTEKQNPLTPHNTYRTHVSPRALKPLLVSPGLKPDHPPTPGLNHEAEHILTTRSNYQNLMEGKAAALGIGFTPQIKSGIEVRRTAHKAAEQKRRDSLKEWFDRLRLEVEEGYVKKRSGLKSRVIREQQREVGHASKRQRSEDDEGDDDEDEDPLKPLSKVLLLRYAYEYIAHLKDTLAERDDLIASLKNEAQHSDDTVGEESTAMEYHD